MTLNGKKLEPGEDGNVAITISETEVDESLNVSSTNPVQNAAVAAKLMEIEASTVLGMNAELSDDGSSVRLALTNKSGAEIASADFLQEAAVEAVTLRPRNRAGCSRQQDHHQGR